MNTLILGLELMVFGLIGVFAVLILFYLTIILLVKFFPYHSEK